MGTDVSSGPICLKKKKEINEYTTYKLFSDIQKTHRNHRKITSILGNKKAKKKTVYNRVIANY